MPARSQLPTFLALAVAGAVADLWSKAWAMGFLGGVEGNARMILEPWLEITLRFNRGTAFSAIFDLGETVRVLFGVGAMLVVAAMAWMSTRAETTRLQAAAYGVLAGGAVGNGWDRMFREAPGGGTGVVDFVKLNYPWGGSWPAFNVADALLVVGVGLLLLGWPREGQRSA
ncbi:MAG: hypothetical protein RIT45_3185 [Pseudomonadota bacterium]|jgi:lipoprotein signal peptidase